MAEIDDLYGALEKADAAGNAGDAREIAAMIRQMEGGAKTAPATAPASTASPAKDERGIVASVADGVGAFAANALDAATFGAAGPVAAYVASQGSRILGGEPLTYKQARERQQQYMRELEEQNPKSALAGKVAGSITSAVGLAKGAAKVAPGLVQRFVPQRADTLGKAAGRLAAGGAVAGATGSALETGVDQAEAAVSDVDVTSKTPVGDALTAGAIGAVAGPVAGGIASVAASGVAKAKDVLQGNSLGNGWRYLARKLDVDPVTLRRALDDYETASGGQRASVAQVLDMRQQGVLSELARDNARAGVRFTEAAEEAAEALPLHVRGVVERGTGGTPRTVPELEAVRDTPAGAFMEPLRQQGARVQVSRRDADLFDDQFFRQAVRGMDDPTLRQQVADAADALARPNVSGYRGLSVDTLDRIRSTIATNDWDRTAAPMARQIADRLAGIIDRSAPGYRRAVVDDYAAGARRIEGYGAGQRGDPARGSQGQTLRQGETLEGYGEGTARRVYDRATDPSGAVRAADELAGSQATQEALDAAYGQVAAGNMIEGGRQLARGQRALDRIAPGRVRSEPSAAAESRSLADIGGAVGAVASGSPGASAFRIARLLPNRISERTAERLAEMLASRSPNRIAQAISNLERAGADETTIRELVAASAAGGSMEFNRRREPRIR